MYLMRSVLFFYCLAS